MTEIEPALYRFGHTKLFFKAGIIGQLEDMRDARISEILTSLQTRMRFKLSRDNYIKTIKERDGAVVIQANWRAYCILKDWEWQKLLFKIRPLLNTTEKQKEMEEMLAEYESLMKELEIETALRKKLEQEHMTLVQMKNKLQNDFTGIYYES